MYNHLHHQPTHHAPMGPSSATHLHPHSQVARPNSSQRAHPLLPTPISAWEAKQQAVVAQSAKSHMINRPQLQTGERQVVGLYPVDLHHSCLLRSRVLLGIHEDPDWVWNYLCSFVDQVNLLYVGFCMLEFVL